MLEDIKNFFKDFFKGKKDEQKNKQTKYSPLIISVLIIAIIIPTVFAIFYAHFYDEPETISSNTIEILLYDSENVLLSSDKVSEADVDSSPLASSFFGMMLNKQPISVPTNELGTPNFYLVFNRKDISERYQCYFTSSVDTSYISSESGILYSFDEVSYKQFLNLDIAQAAYESAKAPKLLTGDGEEVLPSDVTWKYKKQNGDFIDAKGFKTADEIITYRIGGAISVAFDVVPDTLSVRVCDASGAEIFNGQLADLPFVTVRPGETVDARINATWEKREERGFHGNIIYDFKVTLVNRAEFMISSDSINAGNFIIVSIKNAYALDKIRYSSSATDNNDDLALMLGAGNDSIDSAAISALYSYSPKFVIDGEYARAIIPFASALPSGSFGFSLYYGASNESFNISVRCQDPPTQYAFEKDYPTIAGFISDSGMASLKAALSSVKPPVQSLIFARGAFSAMTDYGFSMGYTYNGKLTTSDNLITFDSVGSEFTSTSVGGHTARALNIGIVAEVGYCAYLGNYVVLEHGMGLRTWYCGLNMADVQVGDIVAKGDVIGKSGSTSLTTTEGVLLLCSVYDTLIDPSSLFYRELSYGIE